MRLKSFLLILLLMLQACSASGPVYFYQGKTRHASETARLVVPGPITVSKIDGIEIDVSSPEDEFYEIYLLPGFHRVEFRYELFWGDNTSGMLITSDVVGVRTRFSAGNNYKIAYPVPESSEEAYEKAHAFKAVLLEQETGHTVAAVPLIELLASSAKVNREASDIKKTPADIDADTAVREDAVKRLKFWWMMSNEKERQQFIEWMKTLETTQK